MRGQFKRMVQNTVPTPNLAFRRFRTCDRKKVYENMAADWQAVAHIKANGKDFYPDFELRPYECTYCGSIHVGHSNTPKSTEARMRAQEQSVSAQ